MDRVFLREGGTGWVKHFRHVLVLPAFAQQHAMRMHLAAEHYPPTQYEKRTDENTGTSFDVEVRDVGEHEAYTDEPFMEELAGLDMFDSIRAARPDPTSEAVAVRGDNVPYDFGDHPALGHRHNDMSQMLHTHHVPPLPPGTKLPPPRLGSAVLINRRCNRNTPEVVRDVFNYVTDKAHAETFGGPAILGRGVQDSFYKYDRVATHSCATAVPDSTKDRDRDVVVFSQAADMNVQDAIKVVPNTREAPQRSGFAKTTRLLMNRTPVPQPTSAATGVAPHLRGMGGEKTSAMAEGTGCKTRKRRELDEGMGSGAGGDSQTQPDRRDGYGQLLGPPPEGRAPASALHNHPLICKRLVPAVNAVEHGCYGSACNDDVRESPRLDETVHGDFAAFPATPANGVSAMADSVSYVAKEAEVQTVAGDVAEAWRESHRVAAARRNAARVMMNPR